MLGWLSGIKESITSLANSFTQGLNNLGTSIINGLNDALKSLFVPNTEELNKKIESIKSNFGFVDDVKKSADKFKTFFSLNNFNTSPSISMDFGNAKGIFKKCGTAFALKFDWYTPYRPTVNKLIVAFCYGGYLWMIFLKLPSIISGTGASVYNHEELSNKVNDLERGFKLK